MKDRALSLHEQGLSYRAIADELGVSYSKAFRLCNPAVVAGYERKRRAKKEAWARQNYRGTCARCGRQTSKRQAQRCDDCDALEVQEARDLRLSLVEGMWADGWTLREIASVFGHQTIGGVCQWIDDLRREGRAPLRRTPEQAARIREGRWGRETMANAA